MIAARCEMLLSPGTVSFEENPSTDLTVSELDEVIILLDQGFRVSFYLLLGPSRLRPDLVL